MGLLSRGNDMLNRSLGESEAVTVTYARGATTLTITDALVGRSILSSNQQGAARVVRTERDYLIPAASMGALGTPAEGDRITETINGTATTFKVLTPPTGEPAVRFSDEATRTTYRVHTKRVAT